MSTHGLHISIDLNIEWEADPVHDAVQRARAALSHTHTRPSGSARGDAISVTDDISHVISTWESLLDKLETFTSFVDKLAEVQSLSMNSNQQMMTDVL
jgi:hypothetical protein